MAAGCWVILADFFLLLSVMRTKSSSNKTNHWDYTWSECSFLGSRSFGRNSKVTGGSFFTNSFNRYPFPTNLSLVVIGYPFRIPVWWCWQQLYYCFHRRHHDGRRHRRHHWHHGDFSHWTYRHRRYLDFSSIHWRTCSGPFFAVNSIRCRSFSIALCRRASAANCSCWSAANGHTVPAVASVSSAILGGAFRAQFAAGHALANDSIRCHSNCHRLRRFHCVNRRRRHCERERWGWSDWPMDCVNWFVAVAAVEFVCCSLLSVDRHFVRERVVCRPNRRRRRRHGTVAVADWCRCRNRLDTKVTDVSQWHGCWRRRRRRHCLWCCWDLGDLWDRDWFAITGWWWCFVMFANCHRMWSRHVVTMWRAK